MMTFALIGYLHGWNWMKSFGNDLIKPENYGNTYLATDTITV